MRDGRGQGDQSGKPWRTVGWRSIGQIADDLIERMQAKLVANDNKPMPLVRVQAPTHTRDDD